VLVVRCQDLAKTLSISAIRFCSGFGSCFWCFLLVLALENEPRVLLDLLSQWLNMCLSAMGIFLLPMHFAHFNYNC
jgi:hypothetical protein